MSRPTTPHRSRSPPASPPATSCRRRGQIVSRSQPRACSHQRATTAYARANTLSGSAPARTARGATPAHRCCAAVRPRPGATSCDGHTPGTKAVRTARPVGRFPYVGRCTGGSRTPPVRRPCHRSATSPPAIPPAASAGAADLALGQQLAHLRRLVVVLAVMVAALAAGVLLYVLVAIPGSWNRWGLGQRPGGYRWRCCPGGDGLAGLAARRRLTAGRVTRARRRMLDPR